MTTLESRGLDLDALLEVDTSDDVPEELVSIQFPPLAIGGWDEFEGQGQARLS